MELIALHHRAAEWFGRHVEAVRDDQWANPTPCEDWDVRALVNHLVSEQRWAPLLLHGATVEEVGDRLDGDVLGDDPVAAWRSAVADALDAVAEDGVLERTVNVSWGQIPGETYVGQMTTDLVVHGWDVARGIGGDERIDPELARWVYDWSKPQEDFMKESGLFGERLDIPDDADTQTKLLLLFGRRP